MINLTQYFLEIGVNLGKDQKLFKNHNHDEITKMNFFLLITQFLISASHSLMTTWKCKCFSKFTFHDLNFSSSFLIERVWKYCENLLGNIFIYTHITFTQQKQWKHLFRFVPFLQWHIWWYLFSILIYQLSKCLVVLFIFFLRFGLRIRNSNLSICRHKDRVSYK